MNVGYREAEVEDLQFIVTTWVESYKNAHSAGLISMPDWSGIMTPQVRKVLARSGVQVWVAHWKGETDRTADLLGWVAVERGFASMARMYEHGKWVERLVPESAPLVHFVYVKQQYRESGVCRGLFKAAKVNHQERFLYTCRTACVPDMVKKHAPHAHWTPLIARYPKHEGVKEKAA
jgi:hypothetical protein